MGVSSSVEVWFVTDRKPLGERQKPATQLQQIRHPRDKEDAEAFGPVRLQGSWLHLSA